MKLRLQLVFVSLVMLLLPWAGCQYVNDMEAFMRHSQILGLEATARAAAARIENDERLLEYFSYGEAKEGLYVGEATAEPLIDGYTDDWVWLDEKALLSDQTTLIMSHHYGRLYILLDVVDDVLVYHNPATGSVTSGDHVLVKYGAEQFLLRTSAPGRVTALKEVSGRWRRTSIIASAWLETQHGYRLEASMPLPPHAAPFAIAAVNFNGSLEYGDQTDWFNLDSSQQALALKYKSDAVETALRDFSGENLRLIAKDLHGSELADVGNVNYTANTVDEPYLLTLLYKLILRNRDIPVVSSGSQRTYAIPQNEPEQPTTIDDTWFYRNSALIGRATQPIGDDGERRGVLLVEQSTNDMLGITNEAFNRLFLYTFLGTFIALAVLLTYASWLSLRIRRLSVAAQSALATDGSLQTKLPSVRSSDEIGDLARSYQTLLNQLREYTNYLRTLADKLSHELRTPLAIAKSSLDNLDTLNPTEEQKKYVMRAQSGLHRLGEMLTAMSAARRLEESLAYSEPELIDLPELLAELLRGYQQSYPNTVLKLQAEPALLQLAPELIAQMLDKLIDNAADFCPAQGEVVVRLVKRHTSVELLVSNDGELLPANMQQQLFDSLVSSRNSGDKQKVHLGLGLYIVKLIAEFHNGSVTARNRDDLSGVEFIVALPLP